jgi:hypothetical protein
MRQSKSGLRGLEYCVMVVLLLTQAGLALAQSAADSQRAPNAQRPADAQRPSDAQRSPEAQLQLDRRRLSAIYATQPRRSNGPLRRDNITDEEVGEVQAAAKEVFVDQLLNISGVTEGCEVAAGFPYM